MSAKLGVSVVLLVRDEMRTLPAVVNALFSQEGVNDVEILAIDSGSRDGSREYLASSPIRLLEIPSTDFHHSRTRNLGAEVAKGDLVVWLAADAIPLNRRWLACLVGPFANPLVMGAYGRQVSRLEHGPLQTFRLSYIYPDRSCTRTRADVGRGDERAYSFSDVNSCVRRAFWEAHRYPENIPIAEDVAMARAIIDTGFATAYVAEAVVEHSHDFSPRELFRRYYALGAAFQRIGLGGRGMGPRLGGAGLHYARREFRWCLRHHGALWASRSAAASLAKAVGYLLGRRQASLPKSVRRILEYRPRADATPRPS